MPSPVQQKYERHCETRHSMRWTPDGHKRAALPTLTSEIFFSSPLSNEQTTACSVHGPMPTVRARAHRSTRRGLVRIEKSGPGLLNPFGTFSLVYCGDPSHGCAEAVLGRVATKTIRTPFQLKPFRTGNGWQRTGVCTCSSAADVAEQSCHSFQRCTTTLLAGGGLRHFFSTLVSNV
jgi:hypothetical protein